MYDKKPFEALEVVLKAVVKDYVPVLVFHLSHLFLRIMLIPEHKDCYLMFRSLHSHQTIMLLSRSADLLDFDEWLEYVKALAYDQEHGQVLAFVKLVKEKLDLTKI